MPSQPKSKPDSFAELARAIEADKDEARWEDRLRKIAEHKPKEKTDDGHTAKK